MSKILYNEMTWQEVNEAVNARKVILVPVGAIEQHGPHLPIDTDNGAVYHICVKAAEKAPEILTVAPPIHYGFNEHNMDFPGTVSIEPENLIGYVFDVCNSLAYQGFERIVIVNGHGSNAPFLEIVARRVTNRTGALCALVSYWDLTKATVSKLRESEFPGGMAHACEFETSIALATRPQLVYKDKIRKEIGFQKAKWIWWDLIESAPIRFMDRWSRMSKSGVQGDPTKASAEKGNQIIEAAVSNLVDFATEFRDRKVPPREDHRTEKSTSSPIS